MKKAELVKLHPGRKTVAFDTQTHVFETPKSRSAVEITVKLRRRKSESKSNDSGDGGQHALPESSNFRTGSWHDLLQNQHTHHRESDNKYETTKITQLEEKNPKDNSESSVQVNLIKQQVHRSHKGRLASRSPSSSSNKQIKLSKSNASVQVNLEELTWRKENETLRRQACDLMDNLNKAKAELKECFSTIKDLRKLSDLLKYENECLIESRDQRLELENSFKNALIENSKLTKQIQALKKQYEQSTTPKDQQISKFRSAIKEIKSTIDDEIDEMRQGTSALNSNCSLFKQFRGDELLDESNPSEIARLINSTSSLSLEEEEKSSTKSTQYLDVPKPSSGNGNPEETKRGAAPTNWNNEKSLAARTSDILKSYAVQGTQHGKGDHSEVEFPLRDSLVFMELPIHLASSSTSSLTSNKFSSSSTLNHSHRS